VDQVQHRIAAIPLLVVAGRQVNTVFHRQGEQVTAQAAFLVATALLQAGEKSSSTKAVAYLEGKLNEIDDAYTMALTAYALELANSSKAVQSHDKL
jgi:hypothetical protein